MTIGTAEQVEQTPVEQGAQEAEATPAESNEQNLNGLLDAAAGRMAHERPELEPEPLPAPEEASETPKQPEQESQSSESETPIEAPAHWPDERKKEFSSLPPAAQKILADRHKEMERGYNDKYQELAKQRTEVQAWQQLNQRIQTDPQFAQHVFSYGQEPAQVEKPEFDDPVAELEYNAAQRARDEVLKEITPQLEKQRQVEHQMQLQSILAHHQRDPLYNKVDAAMREYVASQPTESMKQELYRRLDSDPRAYTETYQALRQRVETEAKQPETPAQRAPAQRKVTPREAPQLESAGGPVSEEGARRSKRLSDLTKKIKQNKADPDDIGRYFELNGVLDRF